MLARVVTLRASAVAVAEAAHSAVGEDDLFVRLQKYG